ncbi:Flp pilus assembly protein CpaB [Vibrio nigripulchritudo]|uniref:Flp pilus assembly protein CpaB n=1 Tax=Vibrio nigripulchritudo TaxID=28173 RepID=UPI002491B3F6|nr:Flp pilus assembly protein CpaB [Vibrio nigripulchritudo]BDU39722.1 Flp pilus assembly protein CpaB [Vibrio nigripulchritudo]BDU45445.1 Flp pilus assembly protein CpaB [Vibrio nigripulchritudo]
MKSKLIIVCSIVAILIGLYGVAGSLTNQENDSGDAKLEKESQLKVWRVSENVSKGTFVRREMLEVHVLPESEAHSYAVTEDVKLTLNQGTVFRTDLKQGDLVFNDKLIQPEDDGYVHYIIAPNRVPYAVEVPSSNVVGGLVENGSLVDVVALSLQDSEIADSNLRRTMSITPVLIGVKAIQVRQPLKLEEEDTPEIANVSVILELTRKQVAKLTVAKRISELEVHKSIGQYTPEDLQADAGDVLADFRSITEFRAGESAIK